MALIPIRWKELIEERKSEREQQQGSEQIMKGCNNNYTLYIERVNRR